MAKYVLVTKTVYDSYEEAYAQMKKQFHRRKKDTCGVMLDNEAVSGNSETTPDVIWHIQEQGASA